MADLLVHGGAPHAPLQHVTVRGEALVEAPRDVLGSCVQHLAHVGAELGRDPAGVADGDEAGEDDIHDVADQRGADGQQGALRYGLARILQVPENTKPIL